MRCIIILSLPLFMPWALYQKLLRLCLYHSTFVFFADSGIVGLQPVDFVPNAPQHAVDGRQEEIPVVIAASEDRLGGAIAAINSIQHNTRSNVIFYIVTLNGTGDHLR